MRYFIIISIGCFLLSYDLHGKNDPDTTVDEYRFVIDSLSRQLRSRNTVAEALVLFQIGSLHYRNFNFGEGLECAEEVNAIGRALHDTDVIIKSLRLFADNYYALGRYEASTEYLLDELVYHKKSGDRKKIAEIYCNVGVNYEERGLLEKGMHYYLEALKLYEQVDDKEGIVATLSNLAYVYRSQGNNAEAIAHFTRASEIEEKYLPVRKEHYFLANIAESYKNMGEYATALSCLAKADSLLKEIEAPDDEDLLIAIDVAKIQADIYNEQGQAGEAKEKYLEALVLSRKTGYPEKEGKVVAAMGIMLMNRDDLAGARHYLDEGRRIAEETGSFYLKKDVYHALSSIAAKQKAYREAWEYQRLYNAASDSVINLESAAQLANMQVRYETDKKEGQIHLLTKEKELQALRLQKSENQKIYMALIALLLMTLTAVMLNRYRLKKKSAALLAMKNAELSVLNATKDKFFAIIAHDLRNPVSAFYQIADQIDQYFDSLSHEELKYYISELSSASSGLLAMLKNLLEWSKSQRNQIAVSLTGISPAAVIHKAVEEVRPLAAKSGISVIIERTENQIILSDEHILITVLRNLLVNAIKFSPENSQVVMASAYQKERLVFRVTDQGIGITDEDMKKLFRIDVDTKTIGTSAKKGTGLGLIICREFLDKIGGRIWAESIPGKGSTFYVSIPAKPMETNIN